MFKVNITTFFVKLLAIDVMKMVCEKLSSIPPPKKFLLTELNEQTTLLKKRNENSSILTHLI